jgi:hypothetical protein
MGVPGRTGGETAGKRAFRALSHGTAPGAPCENRDIADPEVLIEVAREEKLDVDRFRKGLPNRNLLAKIGADYIRGVKEHGLWGTPTLVFNGRQAAYLQLRPAPPPEESVKLFEGLFELIYRRPYVVEVKRPRVP